jgi:hypothetical protein
MTELQGIEAPTVIAVTGDSVSYSLDPVLAESEMKDASRPDESLIIQALPNARAVFSDNWRFFNHLVILSRNDEFPGDALRWTEGGIVVHDSPSEMLVQVANRKCRGLADFVHKENCMFISSAGSRLSPHGVVPEVTGGAERTGGRLDTLFDRIAMNCVTDRGLKNPVTVSGAAFMEALPTILMPARSAPKGPRKGASDLIPLDQIQQQVDQLARSGWRVTSTFGEAFRDLKADMDQAYDEKRQLTQDIAGTRGALKSQYVRGLNAVKRQIGTLTNQKKALNSLSDAFMRLEIFEKQTEKVTGGRCVRFATTEDPATVQRALRALCGPFGVRSDFEMVPLITIYVNHTQSMALSREEFDRRVKSVCDSYGVVVEKGPYKQEKGRRTDGPQGRIGKVIVEMFSYDFCIPFAADISEAFGQSLPSRLAVPSVVCPSVLLSGPTGDQCNEILRTWLADNQLNLQGSGRFWYGSGAHIQRGAELFASPKSRPRFPFKLYQIPGGINMTNVMRGVRTRGGAGQRWMVDIRSRSLVVPESVQDAELKDFLEPQVVHNVTETNDLLADYFGWCVEEAVQSRSEVALYKKDGPPQIQNFCVTCVKSLLSNVLENVCDGESQKPRLDLLTENIEMIRPLVIVERQKDWPLDSPVICLGQLLWALVKEPELQELAKAWITSVGSAVLHHSPMFCFCPVHCQILMPHPGKGKELRCLAKECPYFMCRECGLWHSSVSDCTVRVRFELPPGHRKCPNPNCGIIVCKTAACNHIACRCGQHFCFYCGAGPWTEEGPCYTHMMEHGGCFNHPPDWRRVVEHETVSDWKIAKLYRRYPKAKWPDG